MEISGKHEIRDVEGKRIFGDKKNENRSGFTSKKVDMVNTRKREKVNNSRRSYSSGGYKYGRNCNFFA